jgi:hypothetical protein
MSVKLAPWGNDQFESSAGVPGSGWKINTYQAGSSTPATTYTTSAGSVANANPIVLNALGMPDNQIWLTEGQSYKFVLTDENDVVKKTMDNLSGINDTTTDVSQWQASGITPTYISATSFSLPGDQTTEFHMNRRGQFTVSGGTVYGTIASSTFGALTTVTLTMDSGMALDAGLSAANLSIIRADRTALPFPFATLMRGHIGGLLMSNNATDANNDIDISAGEAVDSSRSFLMQLASTMTKRLDAAWAVGTGNGGLFSGAKAISTWYHVHLIRKTSDGSIDAGFDTSVTAANIPAGYVGYRHIGSVRTNSAGNIEAFLAYETGGGGLRVMWSSPTLDIDLTNTLTTTARTDAIHVPTGYAVDALLNIFSVDTVSGYQIYISSPDVTDSAASSTAAPLATTGASTSNSMSVQVSVMTNASGQIRSRANLATVNEYRVSTVGYQWGRR